MESLSRQQVRSIDRCAIETLGIPGLILMENAGRNAADEIEKFVGGVSGKSFAIVAGSGNNGGDGFVIAIDIPTGLDCDSGRAEGPVVRADLTVTMMGRKKGFDVPGAEIYTGEVRVVDIGIPFEHVARIAREGDRGRGVE